MDLKQQCSRVLMIEPSQFGFNAQTANSNVFQHQSSLSSEKIQQLAQEEFQTFVAQLRAVGIDVHTLKNTVKGLHPDAVFPNNWMSLHTDGTLVLYPMLTKNRRLERDPKIIDYLQAKFDIHQIKDFSKRELHGEVLEGTGSMVFDHLHKVAYACLSERTSRGLFEEVCQFLDYAPISFDGSDEHGNEIYHTNVMMAIGETYALICTECISNRIERKKVVEKLEATGHSILPINFAQMRNFAGNALELINKKGERILAISQSAIAVLTSHQINALEKDVHLLTIRIPTIEHIGGGSVRCMLAELFCPLKP